ncbi:MAG: protein TolQ [Desulfobacterales bacterium]|nr:protein TolQ [Desulfobacterales bacterium]
MSSNLDLVYMISNAGFVVQMVMLLLLFFSITSWAIIIIKFRYLKRAFRESSQFVEFFWKCRDLSDAFSMAKKLSSSPVARIFRVGYVELNKVSRLNRDGGKAADRQGGDAHGSINGQGAGAGNVKRALRRATNTEMTRMAQMVPFLATTGNTTPFIGLFGTVWGIMNSFHGIGLTGSASLAVVAPGISEALVATAAGLAAAIPAVIAFNHFSNRIGMLEAELNNFSADFLNIVERDILITGGNRK